MSFKAAEQRKLIEQLRQKTESLKRSQKDLSTRLADLQSAYLERDTDLQTAKDLADFYEKQAAENEKLAELFRQVLIALAECKIDISDLILVPDKIKQVVTARNSYKQLCKDKGILKGGE